MMNKLSHRNNVNVIFSSILSALLITMMILSAVSVSHTNVIPINNNTKNTNNTNSNTNTSNTNFNTMNTLHNIDQAQANIQMGDLIMNN
jgi:hypothetical protein